MIFRWLPARTGVGLVGGVIVVAIGLAGFGLPTVVRLVVGLVGFALITLGLATLPRGVTLADDGIVLLPRRTGRRVDWADVDRVSAVRRPGFVGIIVRRRDGRDVPFPVAFASRRQKPTPALARAVETANRFAVSATEELQRRRPAG